MADESKLPVAAIAAFIFALLYVGFTLSMQLPILFSRPAAEHETAARIGAIVGLIIECAAIMALGFEILKKRVWAAWSLFVLSLIEIMLNLMRNDFSNALLPLILLSLVLWAANSLRAQSE